MAPPPCCPNSKTVPRVSLTTQKPELLIKPKIEPVARQPEKSNESTEKPESIIETTERDNTGPIISTEPSTAQPKVTEAPKIAEVIKSPPTSKFNINMERFWRFTAPPVKAHKPTTTTEKIEEVNEAEDEHVAAAEEEELEDEVEDEVTIEPPQEAQNQVPLKIPHKPRPVLEKPHEESRLSRFSNPANRHIQRINNAPHQISNHHNTRPQLQAPDINENQQPETNFGPPVFGAQQPNFVNNANQPQFIDRRFNQQNLPQFQNQNQQQGQFQPQQFQARFPPQIQQFRQAQFQGNFQQRFVPNQQAFNNGNPQQGFIPQGNSQGFQPHQQGQFPVDPLRSSIVRIPPQQQFPGQQQQVQFQNLPPQQQQQFAPPQQGPVQQVQAPESPQTPPQESQNQQSQHNTDTRPDQQGQFIPSEQQPQQETRGRQEPHQIQPSEQVSNQRGDLRGEATNNRENTQQTSIEQQTREIESPQPQQVQIPKQTENLQNENLDTQVPEAPHVAQEVQSFTPTPIAGSPGQQEQFRPEFPEQRPQEFGQFQPTPDQQPQAPQPQEQQPPQQQPSVNRPIEAERPPFPTREQQFFAPPREFPQISQPQVVTQVITTPAPPQVAPAPTFVQPQQRHRINQPRFNRFNPQQFQSRRFQSQENLVQQTGLNNQNVPLSAFPSNPAPPSFRPEAPRGQFFQNQEFRGFEP